MNLTKEEAVRLHVEMWTDMKEALGDCPEPHARKAFKQKWCEEHFPGADIWAHCFLCEYGVQKRIPCSRCAIDWGLGGCRGNIDFQTSPISMILALPERSEDDRESNRNH